MTNPLAPSTALLAKLGSVVIHCEEYLSPHGHAFDLSALTSLIKDNEIRTWLDEMQELALVPKPRTKIG